MRIIHQQWQLVGSILIVDDDGNAQVIGKDAQGQEARVGTVAIGVERFRSNEFVAAYEKARVACDEILAKFPQAPQVAPLPEPDALALPLVPAP